MAAARLIALQNRRTRAAARLIALQNRRTRANCRGKPAHPSRCGANCRGKHSVRSLPAWVWGASESTPPGKSPKSCCGHEERASPEHQMEGCQNHDFWGFPLPCPFLAAGLGCRPELPRRKPLQNGCLSRKTLGAEPAGLSFPVENRYKTVVCRGKPAHPSQLSGKTGAPEPLRSCPGQQWRG